MVFRRISRRRLGQLIAAALPLLPRRTLAQAFDQGIGGTGVVGDPKDESSDQMIGGTGVVGTIRRFGSIYVNGVRIGYPPTLPVGLAGGTRGTSQLRLGQVVRVATIAAPGPLTARAITIEHEVVGPIEALGPDRMVVLGQTVALAGVASTAGLVLGRHVAVSGLRRLDGSIAASLIEPAEGLPVSVAGPLDRKPDGTLGLGALRLADVDLALVGQRIYVTGHPRGGMLRATRVVSGQTELARLGATRFSIEGYVGRDRSGVRLGSGLQLASSVAVPAADEPAIVTVVLTRREGLVAAKIETEPATDRPTTRDTRAPERENRPKGDKGDKGEGSGSKHGSEGGAARSGGGSHGHR